MNNKKMLNIFILVILLFLQSFNIESQVTVSELPPVNIYDEENLLKLYIEDAEKYH